MSAQLTLTDREMAALLRCDLLHGGPDIEAARTAAAKLRKGLNRPSRRLTLENRETPA